MFLSLELVSYILTNISLDEGLWAWVFELGDIQDDTSEDHVFQALGLDGFLEIGQGSKSLHPLLTILLYS